MKKHSFVPSMDGRLEERVVMSNAHAAGIVVNLPDGTHNFVPNSAILTTRAYNSILNNIHKSIVTFGKSQGTDADYARVSQSVASQLYKLPHAKQEGLVDYVAGSLNNYAPSEAKIAYSDTRSTVVSYLSYKVLNGEAAIRKSPGHYYSDADIFGKDAAIFNQQPTPVD
ncbi:hypothetical protein [Paludisphaera borealis]|uniref:Uncharacterized protein n=1 Tax=Paludisphaera borealis TaxID=1387353 RepID=A0A1U7CIT7_9BACT|nr:hypothetical protein [Paludisphaera borealis]APW58816.1 hypothetical protein BSF38_00220 [Paludisphaera borealis]